MKKQNLEETIKESKTNETLKTIRNVAITTAVGIGLIYGTLHLVSNFSKIKDFCYDSMNTLCGLERPETLKQYMPRN